MKTSRLLLSALLAFSAVLLSHAAIGIPLQMQLGNPSNATADANNHTNYLIQRAQYAMDYNDTTREPNWVSWDLTSGDVGSSGRSNFIVDTELPPGFYQVQTTDYSGSGYDRGHMCPSADRTVTTADNQVVFTMSNMIPQTPDNNQGVWASFETYCRTLASAGNEILITSGVSGFGGSKIASGVAIPGYTWKIAVVVPLGPGTAVDRIVAAGASAIRVIAIKIPNIAGVRSTPWENFVTSAAQIQADTGLTFFTALPAPIASALRNVVDGSSAAGSPTITNQPTAQTTVVGGSATFSVTADGNAPLSYQWLFEDVEIPGATGPTLTLNNVQAANVGTYYVVVTNDVGTTTSNAASLVVMGLPPVITAPPVGQTVSAGSSVTFAVSVTGSPTLTYQWRKNTAPLSGATGSTLTITNAQAGDAGSYDVVVTNSTSSATSAAAQLVVNPSAPSITGQPVSRTVVTAENASFTVTASGTTPMTYQWRKDGSPISDGGAVSGTTTPTLLLTGVTAANGGSYDVIVTNALGFATSSAATLLVNPPPPSTVTWNFGTSAALTADPTSGLSADLTGGTLTAGNNNVSGANPPLLSTTSASTPTSTFSGNGNAGVAARVGALNKAAGGSAYFEFTLAPSAGKRLLVTGISFGSRSTGTGPVAYSIFTSLDGFASSVATGTLLANSTWAMQSPTLPALTGATGAPITVRIYGHSGAGSAAAGTANWRIDDLKLTVNAIFPPPVAPAVTATTPANGATNVTVTDPITITFNEAVAFTGTWFSINSASSGPLAATVTGGPTTFSLTTPSPLPYNDTITVTVFGNQVVDQASGTIPGSGITTFSFTTAVFVPPTPPHVTASPAAQTVNVGSPASFTVAATGTAPLFYQWRKNNTPVSGNASASTATLSIASATLADIGSYDCVVSNVAGSDVSAAASLTVNVVPPTITTQPVGQMVAVGGNATLTVAASGTAPFTYQWRKNGAALNDGGPFSGTHSATLTLTGVTHAETGSYDVIVTNSANSATSSAATLVVTSAAPSVIYWDFGTAAPTSGIPAGVTGGTVTQGNNNGVTTMLTTTSASSNTGASGGNNAGVAARIGALVKTGTATTGSAYFEFTFTPDAGRQFAATALTFGARSTGTGPQAYSVFTSLDGYTTPVASGTLLNDSTWRAITTPFAGVVGTAGTPVTFRIYGFAGTGSPSANTANWRIDDVRLTAGLLALPPVPPSVSTPAGVTATVGDTVQFTVTATGTAPFTYEWLFNGSPIVGNTSAATNTLILPVIMSDDAGDYSCRVTNVAGFATSNPATLTVNKAVATVTLGALDFVYDGAAHATTATTNPANLNVVITYDGNLDAPVNAGSYAVVATIEDDNYTGTAAGVLTIAKAPASVTLTDLEQTYNGTARTIGGTTLPLGLAVAFSYDGDSAAPVNAGSYNVTGTIVDPNYTGAASGTLVVAKAVAAVALDGLAQTYTGAPRTVSASTAPAGLTVALTYDGNAAAPVNAGSYAVNGTVVDQNYTGTATGTLVVGKASATVTLGGLSPTYDGTPKAATATTTPAGLTVNFTYDGGATAPTNAGSYAVVGTVDDVNYTGSANGTMNIARAVATVTLGNLDQTYDGSPKSASASVTPSTEAVTLTYDGSATAPTNAGSYNVVATVNTANYTGTASGTLTIAKATAGVTLDQLAQVYDGTPKLVTVTTSPTGLVALTTYNGVAVAPTSTGSYSVYATVVDPNYAGSASGTLVISQGQATITLSNLTQVYDGTPKPVTVTTTPANLSVNVTYDGALTVPTAPGAYAVVATSTDPNRTGSASGTLVITTTALVRHAPSINGGLDGSVQMLLAEATTLNGSAIVTGDLLVPGTPTVRLNGSPAYGGTIAGTGSPVPTNYTVTLNGRAVLRHVVTRTNAITMPVVNAPPPPPGTRNVSLNNAGQSPGDFATIRDLTLNGNAYPAGLAVPAGTYGKITVNSSNKLILGVAGATTPAVYNLQSLVVNGNGEIVIVGPVVINLAEGASLNGDMGAPGRADWLTVNIANGGLTLNGEVSFDGTVVAPNGTVVINGNAMLTGRVVADRLTINGSGLLTENAP